MQSMEELYQMHAQTVYRYLLSLTHDTDLAEELTQETFYQAIKGIERFDGACKISTWLCAIAKNQWFRYAKRHPKMEAWDDVQSSHHSAETEVLSNLNHMELLRRLHACAEPMREVMYLRLFGNLSFREIGEIMSRTENWARVTYYRGKEKLGKELEQDG